MLSRTLRSAARSSRRLLSTSAEPYDVIVIGGGPGGYPAAIKAGQLGLRVACIESRGRLGGTCLNVGCIPSKALLHSSHLYEEAAHGWGPHGISADNVKMDLGKLMEHKAKTVTGLTGGIEGLLKKYKVDYFKGTGEILKAGSVKVNPMEGGDAQTLATKNIVIATGSVPASLPGVPVDEKVICTSTGALDLTEIPKKMIVIGAGVIGLEMGSVWRRLGAEVEVIEFLDHITPGVDSEIATNFQRTLKKQGMKFKMSTKVMGAAAKPGGGATLTVEPVKGGAAGCGMPPGPLTRRRPVRPPGGPQGLRSLLRTPERHPKSHSNSARSCRGLRSSRQAAPELRCCHPPAPQAASRRPSRLT